MTNGDITILRMGEVVRRTSLSRSSIYRLIRARKFPAPVPITEYSTGYVESEVNAWIADKVDRRDAAGMRSV